MIHRYPPISTNIHHLLRQFPAARIRRNPWRKPRSWLCSQVSWRCHGPNIHSHPEGLNGVFTNSKVAKFWEKKQQGPQSGILSWKGFSWFLSKITRWNCFFRCSDTFGEVYIPAAESPYLIAHLVVPQLKPKGMGYRSNCFSTRTQKFHGSWYPPMVTSSHRGEENPPINFHETCGSIWKYRTPNFIASSLITILATIFLKKIGSILKHTPHFQPHVAPEKNTPTTKRPAYDVYPVPWLFAWPGKMPERSDVFNEAGGMFMFNEIVHVPVRGF